MITGFIVDFYCASACMALEVDGPSHLATKEYDRRRDEALDQLGIRTLRISNDSVRSDLQSVLQTISQEAKTVPNCRPDELEGKFPSPEGRGDRGEVMRDFNRRGGRPGRLSPRRAT